MIIIYKAIELYFPQFKNSKSLRKLLISYLSSKLEIKRYLIKEKHLKILKPQKKFNLVKITIS